MTRQLHWIFYCVLVSWLLPLAPAQYFVVQENEGDAYLTRERFTLDDASCTVTKIENIGEDKLVLNLTQIVTQGNGIFTVDVYLKEPLDFEEIQRRDGDNILEFVLKVTYRCGNTAPLLSQNLDRRWVVVTDVSDSVPEFQQGRYEVTVPENQPINSVVLYNVTAIDPDGGDQVGYSIKTSEDDRERFDAVVSVKNVEGKNRQVLDISLSKPLDYEKATRYSLTVVATDPVNLTTTCEVIIRVKDVQDCPPDFRQVVYSGRIDEMAPRGTSVVTVSALDGDSLAVRNEVVYSLLEDPSSLFVVDNVTGTISTTSLVDIDGKNPIGNNGLVILTVQAEESNSSGEVQYGNTTAMAYVQIQIDDANDHPPRFGSSSYSGSIRGEAMAGEIVSIDGGGYISVTDQDLSPSNNRFRLHIEKDGKPWTVFDTNVKSQFVQASVLIVLQEPEALETMHNTHIKFQIVATDFSIPDSTSPTTNTSTSSVADVMVFVMPRATTAPPPEAIVDLPISESDVIVFIMGFLLLLNIVLTLLVCRLLRRHHGAGGLGLFRRNSKYYVSGRKRVDSGGVERVDSLRRHDDENGNTNTVVKGAVQSHSLISQLSAVKETTGYVVTDPAINRNSVTSAANRNRCDVTHVSELDSVSDNGLTTVTVGGQEDNNTGNNSNQQINSTRCDLTPLKPPRQPIQNESPTENQFQTDFKTGSSSKCDVIPLETSIASTSRTLSSILDKVHQKLAPGSRNTKSDSCDLRPLKDDNSSLDSSFTQSNNSSFSDKTKYGVTPFKDSQSPSPESEGTPGPPGSPSRVNPAFVSDETQADTLEKPNRGKNIPNETVDKSNDQPDATKSNVKQPQPAEKQQPSSSYQFIPTLSPNQTRLTQTGVPPVALALPLGNSTTPKMNNEDKRTNAVTVTNPVYNEGGNGSRTTTVRDFSVPKPTAGILKNLDHETNKNQAASLKPQKETPGTNSNTPSKDKNPRIASLAPPPPPPAPKQQPSDSQQARLDYVKAAKTLLNSSLERVNSIKEGDRDKK